MKLMPKRFPVKTGGHIFEKNIDSRALLDGGHHG
jgi:hypothetical protein